ncbi:hypothetical protein D2E22_1052 [Bifidobacterium castoris]|uniref:Uncharacterized protein n=1 Tax=Bifidobacterium castoris TaxID=2306972 RepID=A0A430F7Q8_9BIFI|nr:hypothetical protein D2E22_1052 [Bifidobacterium castoris]
MSEPRHASYVASCRSCGILHEPCSLNTAVTSIEAHKLVHKHHKCSYTPIKPNTERTTS